MKDLINIFNYQQFLDTLDSLYLILNPEGVILVVNEALKNFVIDDLNNRYPERNGIIEGLTYSELTLTGNRGEIIRDGRDRAFEECISEKTKKRFIDINRDEILEGLMTPILDKNRVRYVTVNIEVVTAKKIFELRKNLSFFSLKEVLFLNEIVNSKSEFEIYSNKDSFIDFYNLNFSEATKRKIDRALMSDSGVFNRSEYIKRINYKIIKHVINLNELLLCMKFNNMRLEKQLG
ncbi:MAG TPA: hypothetical protein PK358_16765 [Spirochaetota bacterium]|nr:hypothetical protein [Spirochaetota bacterium]HPJ36493.1 hypothetical protein [Spirochaetota bacterium]